MVRRRKHGYLEALRENRIPIDRNLVVCERIDYDWALDATIRLLQSENRPDAILAFNDIITFAAFTAIKQLGSASPMMSHSLALRMMSMLSMSRRNSLPSRTSRA
jgi:LacI family transcriptional regulator